MKKIVLDSSVIIKWFKSEQEKNLEQALGYLTDYSNKKINIYIPAIAIFELINTAEFDTSLPEKRWKLSFKKFFELRLETIPIDELLSQEIYDLGRKYYISAYDASYVALAKRLGSDFITADQRLVNKLGFPFVKSL